MHSEQVAVAEEEATDSGHKARSSWRTKKELAWLAVAAKQTTWALHSLALNHSAPSAPDRANESNCSRGAISHCGWPALQCFTFFFSFRSRLELWQVRGREKRASKRDTESFDSAPRAARSHLVVAAAAHPGATFPLTLRLSPVVCQLPGEFWMRCVVAERDGAEPDKRKEKERE